jgi:hypothetical protein
MDNQEVTVEFELKNEDFVEWNKYYMKNEYNPLFL